MGKYDVSIKRLALLLLPTFWRRPLLAAVTYALVAPVQELHTRFMRWRQQTDYRLRYNGQVCHLEAVLNDLFDPGERRIRVTDNAENAGYTTLHHRDAGQSVLLPARGSGRCVILNRRGYGGVNGYDFWVNLPIALYGKTDLAQVRAVVNNYKLASKRFSINFF